MTAAEPVEYSIDSRGVARIHMNRPTASNALDPELATALDTAINSLAAEPNARVLVLSGGGKNFCAGGDVRRMAEAEDTPAFLSDLAANVHRALVRLDSLPITVVAAVQGSAAGAGLGLVLASDFVVASASSKFVAAYSAVGLSPDCGVSILLPRVVGLRRASQMLLAARVVGGVEALEWGLITDLVEDEAVGSRAEELAELLAGAPFPAVGQTRRLARASLARPYAEHLDDEASTIAVVSSSPEAVTRIRRFAAR
ncbi:enoyl-CoA hydratase/isomerase family protein [Rhodococcus erythropolis]|uniref:Enoyl-CoA hydratase/isomerase family protein n=1 Tax=Rhodococcus erythropolis TaxID=1833 RepID=A0A8I0ZVN4_RHOER|nr:enoyl-CoA hydratase/isomerase family protein [Rhodococcus erythropolis]MBH5143503.1 enoyl-CoA hydratase/isomerase family protein [Rhodococcus erythropolis]